MKIKKVIGLLASVSLIAGSLAMPIISFGASETISMDEAVKMAIQSSNSLRKLDNSLSSEQIKYDGSSFGSTGDVFSNISGQREKESLENSIKSLERDKESQKESIEFLLKQTVMGIDKKEKEIALKEKELKNQQENLTLDMMKLDAGKISQYDYDTKKDKIDKSKKSMEIDKKNLEKDYDRLDSMLGVDSSKRKKVTYTVKYEKFKGSEAEIPYIVTKAIEKDPNAFRKSLEILEKQYKADYFIPGDENTEIKDIGVASSVNQMQDLSDNMDKKVRDLYNNIKKNEIAKESLLLDLSTVKKDLEVANKKLELGKIIPQEVKNLEFKKSQIEENLKLNEIDHALLMLQYEKPYI